MADPKRLNVVKIPIRVSQRVGLLKVSALLDWFLKVYILIQVTQVEVTAGHMIVDMVTGILTTHEDRAKGISGFKEDGNTTVIETGCGEKAIGPLGEAHIAGFQPTIHVIMEE